MKIGIDVGGTKTEGLLIGSDGGELERKRINTIKNYEGTIEGIVSIIKEFENKPTGRQYKYAACPYDYYPDKIKKKYLKKMKRKKCNPKEIKNK